jgi:hypothetical protein
VSCGVYNSGSIPGGCVDIQGTSPINSDECAPEDSLHTNVIFPIAIHKLPCLDVTKVTGLMSHQGLILDTLQFLASQNPAFVMEDWRAIASEALAGSAPAQYIVATAFEGLGDLTQARDWYGQSAAQQYHPAVSRLAALQSGSAA